MKQNSIINLDSIDSTNNYARQLLEKQSPEEGTVIYTGFQTSGRGLGDNSWESEPKSNLTFTIILYPEFLRIEQQILLNKTLALSVFDFIKQTDDSMDVKIKWPNDIYIANSKVAGILIENTISSNTFKSCIAGIGININQKVFSSDAPNPTSLSLEINKAYNIDDCLTSLLSCIDVRYTMLKEKKFELINDDYLNNLYRLEKFYTYFYNDRIITAKLTGVTEFGRLILYTVNEEMIECDLKEIKFII